MNDTATPLAHATLGASTCARWWGCPGSPGLIAQLPERNTGTKYSAEGTLAHEIAAAMVLNDGTVIRVSDTKIIDGFEVPVSQAMLDAATQYAEYISSYVAKYRISPLVEQQVRISGVLDEYGDESLFGTADCILIIPYNMLIVIDFKYGAGVAVEAVGNKQLLYYALGAYLALSPDDQAEIPVIRLAIVQPRAGGISEWDIPITVLHEFHDDLKRAVARVRPDAELNAGPHCKFCPAKPVCPSLRDHVANEAGLDFSEIKNPPAVSTPTLPTPLNLTPDMISSTLHNADVIRDWLNAIESHAIGLMQNGIKIPGYKLVAKRSTRVWIDERVVREAVEPLGDAAYTKRELLSVAQLEKIAKPAGINLGQFIAKPDNGCTLAPITDKRPEYSANPADDFIDAEWVI